MIKEPSLKEWLSQMNSFLEEKWGLSDSLAEKIALLLLYSHFYQNPGTITSGFRDPEKQKRLRELWDAGNREGLRARPAVNSLHTLTGWFGSPDASAVDVVFPDQNLAGQIAPFFGLKWGGNFSSRDDVHFFER
jgi:hypothetical protein